MCVPLTRPGNGGRAHVMAMELVLRRERVVGTSSARPGLILCESCGVSGLTWRTVEIMRHALLES
jgi:hypothetical protein